MAEERSAQADPGRPTLLDRALAFAKTTEFRWLLVILVMSGAFRMTWAVYADREPRGLNDPNLYHFFARGIADGDGYTRPTGEPFAYYPIGFPATLGGLYWLLDHTPIPNDYVLAGKLMNGVLGLLTTGLVYLLGRRLFSPAVGLFGAFLHAAWPSQVFNGGTLLSEALFTFLVMLALTVLLWRLPQPGDRRTPWVALIAGGLLLGMATMTRGITLFLPLVFFFLWWASSKRPGMAAMHACILLAGIAVFVVPWSIRNTVQLNGLVFISTNVGDDLCIGHHLGADGKFTLTGPCFDEYDYKNAPPNEIEIARNRDGIRKAVSFAAQHPLREVGLLFDKAYYLFRDDQDGLFAAESFGNDPFMPVDMREWLNDWANIWYYAWAGWALLSLPLIFLSRNLRHVGLGIAALYLLALPLVFFGDPRFHFPAIPLIALIAANGVVTVFRTRRAPEDGSATGLLEAGQAPPALQPANP